MNDQKKREVPGTKKRIIIMSLYLATLVIFFLGVYFCTYSVLNQVKFQVLNAQVPGFVFGALVAYLGLRNFFQVTDFKIQLYQSKADFSWSNFKRKPDKFAHILK